MIAMACGKLPTKPKFLEHPESVTASSEGSATPSDPIATTLSAPSCSIEAFGQTVWAPILAKNCQSCHLSKGLAEQKGSQFILSTADGPNYMAKNYNAFQKAAAPSANGVSLVLSKASGVAHVGGKVITVDSEKYATLSAFIDKKKVNDGCATVSAALIQKLLPLSSAQVLWKAAMQLAGRQPSAQEITLATTGHIRDALETILAGAYFEDYIKRIYNDLTLAEFFKGDNAIEFYYHKVGESNTDWRGSDLATAVRGAWPYYQAPNELARYIIASDRPYTEILTADYLMLNPLTSCDILGKGYVLPFKNNCTMSETSAMNACVRSDFDFTNPYIDWCSEFLPKKPTFKQPVAGLLTDIPYLNIHSTTSSNRNRLRARIVLEQFLGLDVMGLQGTTDVSNITKTAIVNPTMNDPQCAACHAVVDPIASSFQKHDENGMYSANAVWAKDMLPAGFNGLTVPADAEPITWLASQIVKDPRFARNAVAFWYKNLTGNDILKDPNTSDAHYRESLAAKIEQNTFFDDEGTAFAANGFKTREMIKDLILSPYYTTRAIDSGLAASEKLMLQSFGHSGRKTPEDLHASLFSATGSYWLLPGQKLEPLKSNYAVNDQTYLMNDKQLLVTAGGIDSHVSQVRNNDMSSVFSSIVNFASTSMPCKVVTTDFEKVTATRILFPYVEKSSGPSDAVGAAAIRRNIVFLHKKFLGETLAVDDAETIATFNLFKTLYADHLKAGQAASASVIVKSLAIDCPIKAASSEEKSALVGWMGVMSYLMSDYDFIYQ